MALPTFLISCILAEVLVHNVGSSVGKCEGERGTKSDMG